ncbi:uncharacterized protein LOC129778980 [Toxorhynchites rutilus septentrionalis]|uniref:uncharacterized protein LOC129778980 n=1 Tax=Toxorhynchites rutilus septentrionalis TaxID=329112 RepID=UPI00247AD1C2|nr:uncharacterized protein LOC129778980 [Toxorhynchites rutilus septentrionalis]
MKAVLAVLTLALGAAHGSYNPYYAGFNPYAAAWPALGLYNPHVAPLVHQIPSLSGTYAYHDGIRPTVVQANNDGYANPHAVNGLYSPHLLNPHAASLGYYGHGLGYPHKTVVQANLGSGGDPWGIAALYGTGIYGVGYHNYVPASISKYLLG